MTAESVDKKILLSPSYTKKLLEYFFILNPNKPPQINKLAVCQLLGKVFNTLNYKGLITI